MKTLLIFPSLPYTSPLAKFHFDEDNRLTDVVDRETRRHIMRIRYDDKGVITFYSDDKGNWYDADVFKAHCPYFEYYIFTIDELKVHYDNIQLDFSGKFIKFVVDKKYHLWLDILWVNEVELDFIIVNDGEFYEGGREYYIYEQARSRGDDKLVFTLGSL